MMKDLLKVALLYIAVIPGKYNVASGSIFIRSDRGNVNDVVILNSNSPSLSPSSGSSLSPSSGSSLNPSLSPSPSTSPSLTLSPSASSEYDDNTRSSNSDKTLIPSSNPSSNPVTDETNSSVEETSVSPSGNPTHYFSTSPSASPSQKILDLTPSPTIKSEVGSTQKIDDDEDGKISKKKTASSPSFIPFAVAVIVSLFGTVLASIGIRRLQRRRNQTQREIDHAAQYNPYDAEML
jgi:hypothetical protein